MRSRRTRAWVLLPGLAAFAAFAMFGVGAAAAARSEPVDLYLFWLSTCPHCASARAFLEDLGEEYPTLVVHEHEVSSEGADRQLFEQMTSARGATARAVPTIIIGQRVWVGFDDAVAEEVRAAVGALAEGRAPPGEDGQDGADDEELVDVPLVGSVDVGGTSLLVATVVIGFVDGVNPCSLWVLSILLALVLHSGSRRRVLLVGSAFLVVTTALYGLYVAGAYSLLSYASYISWIQRAVAVLVAGFAIINIRDYFRPGQHAVLSIPEGAKPGIYRRARALMAPDRSPAAVLAGTTALAVGVSLVETPCSAALPLLWTDLLAAHDTSIGVAVTLFAIYMLVFLIDELVLFGAAVVTMRVAHLQERHGRALRLVTGTVMLGLAGAMLVDPGLLTDLTGTLTVLAAICALTATVVLVQHQLAQHGHAAPLAR